jgi:chemotaxis protein methyltransferase CheR
MNKTDLSIIDEMEPIDDRTFKHICSFVYEKCGITLTDKKRALVSARIRKRMRMLKLTSPTEYFNIIMNDETGLEVVLLLDAISTNVTSFYREPAHFDFLNQTVKDMTASGQTRFRIWCAASSSGEEPYTIAFTFREACDRDVDVKILATDISTKVLALARDGIYEPVKLKGVPDHILKKYFTRSKEGKTEQFCVKDGIKQMITFSRLNLVETPYPMKGPMDIIFCRNVMIYFDREVRKKLVEEFYRLIKPDGYLIVGHTESLVDVKTKFKRLGPSIYQK